MKLAPVDRSVYFHMYVKIRMNEIGHEEIKKLNEKC